MGWAKGLLGLLLGWAVGVAGAVVDPNPHEAAFACRLKYVEGCDGVCLGCHPPSQEMEDFYLAGDLQLCAGCHPGQTYRQTAGRYLLNLPGGGGNHPAGVPYPEPGEDPQMAEAPQGVKLFCDTAGKACKVYCSTCHDAMGATPGLLRSSDGSLELCLSCHRK